ncbi:diaminopimelate epimerase [Roseivirga sp.]|uniref:diaminopimelate epimerase n=1 Tax=Roseivirga sp. TaxID=1964215 RepID=UPI003B51BB2E
MATISFYKYQGTGNDFVMIDNRQHVFDKKNLSLVTSLCDRRFGIGADGVILIEESEEADFEMVYFNPDGSQSLCGNGSRCAVMFARFLGMIKDETEFMAIDGLHYARVEDDKVFLKMHDVNSFERIADDYLIDTGSPHYIRYTEDTQSLDPVAEGRAVRYSDRFAEKGVNVNFLEKVDEHTLKIRTYERGVEGETLSCGTGCTAAAISLGIQHDIDSVSLLAMGGELRVDFKKTNNSFTDIFLIGPAKAVFQGQIEV